jgi:hypothetical protein
MPKLTQMKEKAKPFYEKMKYNGMPGIVYGNLETGDIFAVGGIYSPRDIPEGYQQIPNKHYHEWNHTGWTIYGGP